MGSMLRDTSVRLAVAAVTAISLSALAQTGMGTWKLNPEKSTFSPGPAPQGLVTYFEPAANGVKWRSERIGPDGKMMTSAYTANFDGKDYPITGSSTTDAVALERIDEHTTVRLNKKDGKVVTTERRVIAPDGMSYVTTVTGTTTKGEPISTRMVFDKQP
jgi:hypothetical protein